MIRKVIARDIPGFIVPAWQVLAGVFLIAGRVDDAETAYGEAIRVSTDPIVDGTLEGLAGVLAHIGRQDEADELYHQVVDSGRGQSPGVAWYGPGVGYAKRGQVEEARAAFTQAIEYGEP